VICLRYWTFGNARRIWAGARIGFRCNSASGKRPARRENSGRLERELAGVGVASARGVGGEADYLVREDVAAFSIVATRPTEDPQWPPQTSRWLRPYPRARYIRNVGKRFVFIR
jgi:hypothetical protein